MGDGINSCQLQLPECPNRHFPDVENECQFAYDLECEDNELIFRVYKAYLDLRGMSSANIGFNDSSCALTLVETSYNGLDVVEAHFQLDTTCGTQSGMIDNEWIYREEF